MHMKGVSEDNLWINLRWVLFGFKLSNCLQQIQKLFRFIILMDKFINWQSTQKIKWHKSSWSRIWTLKYLNSMMRYQYYFLNIWPFVATKNCPIVEMFCQSRFEIWPNAKQTFTKLLDSYKILQSGEISPSLVTLYLRDKKSCFILARHFASKLGHRRVVQWRAVWPDAWI